ncbi:MAG: ComEC/Rec2 family competence protein, partial [Terriglobales bacterium]
YAALAAAAGVAAAAGPLQWGAGVPPATLAGATVALAVAAALAAAAGRLKLAAVLGLIFCFAAGLARTQAVLAHPPRSSALQVAVSRLEPGPRDKVWITGYLRDTPEMLYDSGQASALRLDVEVTSLTEGESAPALPATGGVRLYSYPPAGAGDPPWAAPLEALPAGAGIAASVHLRPLPQYRDPGVADYQATARREGIQLSGTLNLGNWRAWPLQDAPSPMRLRARLWRWLSVRLDRVASPQSHPRVNALLRGMLLGDVARLDATTRENFQIDGVYHLLVVAGLHIGVLAWFLVWLGRRIGLPPFLGGALTLALLAAYAWVIAGRTPTQRAVLMLALYFVARWWYRERQPLNAVGAAALVLLAWHPLDLFRPGWQMSLAAATLLAGVAFPLLDRTTRPTARAFRDIANVDYDAAFSPRWNQFRLDLRAQHQRLEAIWPPLARLPQAMAHAALRLGEVLAISLVLQLGFAAFAAVDFHRASLWSTLANALLVPLAGALLPLAWLVVVALPWASGAVIGLAHVMLLLADALARLPWAGVAVPSPPGWLLVIFALSVASWLWTARRRRRWMEVSWGAMALVTAVLFWAPFPPRLPPGLTATVLDVGQGDSILVTFPQGRTLLVDGGPRSPHWDTGAMVVAPFLWSLGLHHVDAVLLTHGHNDHLGGLTTVLRDFQPSEVWLTRTLPDEPAMLAFLRAVRREGARVRRLDAGDIFRVGTANLAVLQPPPQYQGGEIASNDDSMVVRLSLGGNSMLLEGDAQAAGEEWMLQHGLVVASSLLKVGHHGSNTSSTAAFLVAVHPRVAVISVGRGNGYGLPNAMALARLRAAGARIFRTDRDGAVQCRLTPGTLSVFLFPPPIADRGGG